MPIPTDPTHYARILLEHFSATQTLEGDARLTEILSAERAVTSADRQISPTDRADLLQTLDAIEEELLGPSRAPNSNASPT